MPSPNAAKARTLVLCFDGTSNEFDDTNTNVVKLFGLLKKDDCARQMVYYQAGIGTYAAPGMWGSPLLAVAKLADQAVAWYLDAHVQSGYEFLMQNYRPGDKICLFGFSRGAYTARALAGMLAKVGLLPRDNQEQIPFAYKMYKRDDKEGREQSRAFKATFSRTVTIEFVGVWDTVASVGVMWPRHLPFTSSNHIIRTFRHALSLDERRAKFQANLWHRRAPSAAAASKDPEGGSSVVADAETPRAKHAHLVNTHDEHEEGLGHGKTTDVEEVWFAGCHSDVGGGSTKDSDKHSLGSISLRWMVREIVQSQSGILFDNAALQRAGIPVSSFRLDTAFQKFPVLPSLRHSRSSVSESSSDTSSDRQSLTDSTAPAFNIHVESHNEWNSSTASVRPFGAIKRPTSLLDYKRTAAYHCEELDKEDATKTEVNDEIKKPGWWLLEVLPLVHQFQDDKGKSPRKIRVNLFRPRKILQDSPAHIHSSVKLRMEAKGYKPRAKLPENLKWVH